MRKYFWRFLAVLALLIVAWYGYYKFSSTGYHLGLAKRGRILNSTNGEPVAGAWIIAQWKGYSRGVHGGAHPILFAGVATRTDENGFYTLPAKWRELTHPLNHLPWNTGYYTFGLGVFAPEMQLDLKRTSYCHTIGGPGEPFLCPSVAWRDWKQGGIEERLTDLWITPATSALAERAREYAHFNFETFSDSSAVPQLSPRGSVVKQIGMAQAQELGKLVCEQTGKVPYSVVDDIEWTLVWPAEVNSPPVEKFKAVAKSGVTCHDNADRCPPIDAEKVCAGLHATFDTTTEKKELTP